MRTTLRSILCALLRKHPPSDILQACIDPGEDMYHAWTLIMLSAGLRVTGMLLAHVIDTRPALRMMAHIISGPVQMVFLSWGLGIVLRVYRRLGYSFRLNTRDRLLVAIAVASAICGIVQNIITPSFGVFTDAMLACLLLQAIVLRRSVAQMGGGFVGACSTCYVLAIFLTALGDVGITIAAYGVIPREWLPVTWLIWYPAVLPTQSGLRSWRKPLRSQRVSINDTRRLAVRTVPRNVRPVPPVARVNPPPICGRVRVPESDQPSERSKSDGRSEPPFFRGLGPRTE